MRSSFLSYTSWASQKAQQSTPPFFFTVLLGYELKTAVGTSVFVMTFSALTGAVSHFALGSMPRLDLLVLCVVFTLVWAQIAAKIAAKADAVLLNRLTGLILTLLGIVLVVITFL